MANYSRTQRIGDQIQRELAGLLQLEMKDPRLGMVTVSAVDVTRDLSFADVYVTSLSADNPASREETVATCQLDFIVPERFDLKYTRADGGEGRPFIIHRAPLGTHERMIERSRGRAVAVGLLGL